MIAHKHIPVCFAVDLYVSHCLHSFISPHPCRFAFGFVWQFLRQKLHVALLADGPTKSSRCLVHVSHLFLLIHHFASDSGDHSDRGEFLCLVNVVLNSFEAIISGVFAISVFFFVHGPVPCPCGALPHVIGPHERP